jgi:hypothetical protein
MKKRHAVLFIITMAIMAGGSQCGYDVTASVRPLFKDIPRDSNQIHYLSKNYTRKEFRDLKKRELDELKKHLYEKYKITFKTRSTKYFNIAYRCSESRMNHLQHYLVKFFNQVYPRYFIYEPTHAINMVYFAGKNEFRRYTRSGAYGYYSAWNKTLTTYAYSGHGTLWHELIHAFVDQNCSGHPQQWFNEGFASFYEMAFLRNGRVVEGYTNWRMPYLKTSIREGNFSHLKEMMKEMQMKEEYGYAKARFLFCYLWIHGKMKAFVRSYLYELCPRYRGSILGKKAIKKMEELLGKDIDTIHREYLALARKVKKNQKLFRKKA